MQSVNKWTSDSPTAKQQHKYFLVNRRVSSDDNRDNRNNSANGRNGRMSRGDIQLEQQDYCCQLVFHVNRRVSSDDNRDNRNNSANGRNGRMSRGDIQLGQQDYCCQLVNYSQFVNFRITASFALFREDVTMTAHGYHCFFQSMACRKSAVCSSLSFCALSSSGRRS